jgi:hypothetical protein
MTTLIIRYYKIVGKGRYLRSLSFEEYPKEFINHSLNLGFIKVKNKKELETDFNMCCEIIKRERSQLKANYTQ